MGSQEDSWEGGSASGMVSTGVGGSSVERMEGNEGNEGGKDDSNDEVFVFESGNHDSNGANESGRDNSNDDRNEGGNYDRNEGSNDDSSNGRGNDDNDVEGNGSSNSTASVQTGLSMQTHIMYETFGGNSNDDKGGGPQRPGHFHYHGLRGDAERFGAAFYGGGGRRLEGHPRWSAENIGDGCMDGDVFRRFQRDCMRARFLFMDLYVELARAACDYDPDAMIASSVDLRMGGRHEFDIERFLQQCDDDLHYFADEGDKPAYDDVSFWYLPSQRSCATRRRVSSR